MARLVPLLSLLLLFFLVIVTSSCDEVVSSEVIDGGGPDAVVCDTIFDLCEGSCWKSGNCMHCCRYHGFVHGRCKLKYGDACYCCHTPDKQK